jgi:predicted alpha/beta superfamily hydrolase
MIARVARLLPLFLLALTLGGCDGGHAGDFVVDPGLDPRVSRILVVRPSGFLTGRDCYVYLPPGYPERGRQYPVLYVHDGESGFDRGPDSPESFGFDQAADALLSTGAIEPMIIIAIPGGGWRIRDYIPVIRFTVPDTGFTPRLVPDSTRGDRYVRALRDELKPLIDRTFASDPSPGRTGIAGFSLGGLISVYAFYAYPETFGIAGGFSGSYGGFSPYFLGYVHQTGRPPGGGLFVDVGMTFDNLDDARRMDEIARRQGFVLGVDYEYREIAEGDHSVSSVRRRIPAFLEFFSRRAAVPAPTAELIPR